MTVVVTVTPMVAALLPLPVTVIVHVPTPTGAILSVAVVVAGAVAMPAQPDAVKPPTLFVCDTVTVAGGSLSALNDTPPEGARVTGPGEGVGTAAALAVGAGVGVGSSVGKGVAVGDGVGLAVAGGALVAAGAPVGTLLGVGAVVGIAVAVGTPVAVGVAAGFADGKFVEVDVGIADEPPPPHAVSKTAAMLDRKKVRNVKPLTIGAPRRLMCEESLAYDVAGANVRRETIGR